MSTRYFLQNTSVQKQKTVSAQMKTASQVNNKKKKKKKKKSPTGALRRRTRTTFARAFGAIASGPPLRRSEANSPTPPCRILGMAAPRGAVMCHLAPGSTGAELCVTSLLKLVCH